MAKKKTKKQAASEGGKARASKLSADERKEIASKAALARWSTPPVATHVGTMSIGKQEVSCAVLQDGKRIITQADFLRALGRSRSPKAGTGVLSTVDDLPFFLQAKALQPFISRDLATSTKPVFFLDQAGKKQVGYDATSLPKVAEVYLQYRDHYSSLDRELPRSYKHIVVACDILTRALAHVGIVALVDEATGYQNVRARNALAEILEAFINDEATKWAKRFPDEFYQELFRLKGKKWPFKKNPPQYVGHWTNNIIYKRLAPGVLTDLREKNPIDGKGRRKKRHHQWLTNDIGHPKLQEHIQSVIALMRASDTWDQFEKMLDRSLPKQPQTASDKSQKRIEFDK